MSKLKGKGHELYGLLLSIVLIIGVLAGCSSNNTAIDANIPSKTSTSIDTTTQNVTTEKIKAVIAYAGGTCEAPIFVAYHKGFFEAEGLDVELVQAGFKELQLALTSGTIDAALANFAWFKPIEQGLNIKLTAGVHTGCIKAVVPPDSDIKTIADLKGKTIGVDVIGGGPQIALSAKLREAGINPVSDVSWVAYSGPLLDEAINKGEIAAYMTWDPFPTQAHDHNHFNYLLDIGADDPFKDNYCCFVGIGSEVIKNDAEKAAKITRAILKATEWVGENPEEAAKISLDNNYVAGDVELNAKLLAEYGWTPGVIKAKENIQWYISELKEQGVLEASTKEDDLYGIAFAEVIPDWNGN